MKFVFISDNGSHHKKINIKLWPHIILPSLLVFGIIVTALGVRSLAGQTSVLNDDRKAFQNFNSVIKKLGNVDAEVQRLNALSASIAKKIKLDINDYGLKERPARGGALVNKNYFGSTIVRKKDVIASVKKIESNLAKQKLKLKNLVASLEIQEAEELLASLSKTSKKQKTGIVYDFSTPLTQGYISSPYGKRRDPINGSLRHHGGLDIAAKKGSNVYAVANGFVTFRGNKGAYGKLLEIDHSASLKSRYAHLDAFLVKKGQLVRKGDLIGKVGATGRVTGPHLHLEIKENNIVKNPKIYLKDALRRF